MRIPESTTYYGTSYYASIVNWPEPTIHFPGTNQQPSDEDHC